jgi:prepilin-type N-terminal cleavage/methylation domain-containing protein
MRKDSGFTAYEVAVTLAIVAIMATFVTPPFFRWLQGHRLRGAAINLMADIEMAKIRAIRENAFVAVRFAAGGYEMFVDNGAGGGVAGDWEPNGSEPLVLTRQLPAGVHMALAEVTLADKRVRFNGRGLPPDVVAPELIPLTNPVGRREIRLNRLGSVRIQ